MQIKLKKLHKDAEMPKRATSGAVGYDLCAIYEEVIFPKTTKIIKTGLAVELPVGYEMQIRPRSGISVKTDCIVILGTIDSDYRGEIGIIIKNIGIENFHIKKGDRLAQAVINKVELIEFEETDDLEDTKRGTGGFGHTGLKQLIDEVVNNG